jgi:hypothetical protein
MNLNFQQSLRFPSNRDDLDTTALGLSVVDHVDTTTKHKVIDEILEYRDSDGIIQVYFDHSRPRIGDYLLDLERQII